MGEHVDTLVGIAFVTAVSVMIGFFFVKLRQPSVVGFILAGMFLGPTGLGLVKNSEYIMLMAEFGVIMLLFLIGMELSLKAFKTVILKASCIAAAQVGVALAITFTFASISNWSMEQAIVLGFIVAVSSTAVAIKILEEINELRTHTGRITVGILIAQDIAIVPMLVLVESLGHAEFNIQNLLMKLFATIAILITAMYMLSRRGKIHLPFSESMKASTDLMALGAIALCFGSAAVTGLLGLSAAFGAFLAGLVVANSTIRSEAIQVTLPIQSVLMVVFFLSIGLLIDLNYVYENATSVALFVMGVLIAKSVINILLMRIVGEPWDHAFQGGLALGQIGEFSFVLASAGLMSGALNDSGYRLALTVIAISLLVSPFWMASARKFHIVFKSGVTDFRQALNETYSGDFGPFGHGHAFAGALKTFFSKAGFESVNEQKEKAAPEVVQPKTRSDEKLAENQEAAS